MAGARRAAGTGRSGGAQRAGGPQRPGRQRAPYRGPGWVRHATLGVDVGGVIVMLADASVDTSFFGDRPLETPAVPEVVETLAALVAEPFAGRVHLVSKAGPKVAANTRAWLHHHRFFERTGMPEDNLHFVRERHEKAPVCERLGITHFVDDRLDVLAYLETVEHRYLFRGGRTEPVTDGALPDWVTVAWTWAEVADLVRASVAATRT